MSAAQVAAAELRTRAASILAAKFMLTDKPHAVDVLLAAALPAFLAHLSDSEWCALALPAGSHHRCLSVAFSSVTQ